MDQDTTNKSGSRGSWRDRLGIDEGSSASTSNDTASEAPKSDAPKAAAPKVQAKVIAKPAPMAPRAGTAAKAPARDEVKKAALSPKPEAAESKSTDQDDKAAPQRDDQDKAFAERLRKHREAAEEAVKKRSPSASLEKFSFASKEVEKAGSEKPAEAPAKVATAAADSTAAPKAAPAPKPSSAPQAAPAPRPAQAAPSAAPVPAKAPSVAPMPAPGASPGPRPAPRSAPPQYSPNPAYRPQGPGYQPPPGATGYQQPAQPQRGYVPPGQQPPVRSGYPHVGAAPVPTSPPRQTSQYTPPAVEDDLFEDNGYRPAEPLGRGSSSRSRSDTSLRADFDDPFDDRGGYTGRSADDYSRAYREYDDDYEVERPRRWGGLIMLILGLLTIAALAIGLIFWYQQNKVPSSGETGNVPTVGAPEQPVKTTPDQTQQQPSSAPAQGKKLIYDRILGDESNAQPERIVPREETPQAPATTQQQQSGEGNSLPLPLPPPPDSQSSITPQGQGAQQSTARANPSPLPEPAQQQQVTQEAAAVEPAASAVSSPAATIATGPIANPPIPRTRPNNLVASIQNAPATEFRPVLQPTPSPAPSIAQPLQPQPQPLQPQANLQQQAANLNVNQAQQQAAPQPNQAIRGASRDDDPLSGLRAPLGGTAQQAGQAAQQPQSLALANPPAPQPSQPVTSQSLQSFAPPTPQQQQQTQSASTGTGYVVQLAAYRSEQEAMGQYQRLKSQHKSLLGNLPPNLQKTNLGASGTFYRLGMGPMSSKQAATELCNKLIAAGERDCLVRRR